MIKSSKLGKPLINMTSAKGKLLTFARGLREKWSLGS
jgi:hypothetical protein